MSTRHPRSLVPPQLRTTALLLLALCAAGVARAATYTVGGAGCNQPDLLSALIAAVNNPGADEIRLLSGSSHQGPFFVNTDGLTIRGGYATCAAGSATGTSTLLGTNSSRPLFMSVSGTVFLDRLHITGGSVTGNGGGLLLQGSGALFLTNSMVFGNHATASGGNVFVTGGAGLNLVVTQSSSVTAGDALDGGGIACTGGAHLQFDGDVVIANNAATGDGGGVHLTAGCSLTSAAGGSLASAPGGILNNQAGGSGGGVYLEAGSVLGTVFANPNGLAIIGGNTALVAGGGVAVVGSGSTVTSFFSRYANNHADQVAGALFADDHASAALGRTEVTGPCWDGRRCSIVSGNSATVGGAFFSDRSATITVDSTYVEGNTATTSQPVASVRGGSRLEIRSSVLAFNDGANPLFVADNASQLTLGNVTVAGNANIGSGLIALGTGALGSVSVLSSAFDQTGALFAAGFPVGVAPEADCLISRFGPLLTGLPPASTTRALTTADPLLTNPAAGDYRLLGGSPAIDACDTTHFLGPWVFDLDGNLRDIDQVGVPNPLPGFRDQGAVEHVGAFLFASDFETGLTAAWSATVQ